MWFQPSSSSVSSPSWWRHHERGRSGWHTGRRCIGNYRYRAGTRRDRRSVRRSPSDRAPDQTVYVARFVFQPDAEIFAHGHPGTTVLGVASGSFGWTLEEGTAYVIRGAAAGATGPVEEITEPRTEVILVPGDAIYYEDDVVHTARGAGDEEAVVLGTLVLTSGEPLLMPADMDMAATPEG
jgi:quercetin dioxygenase-like cupin family protein